MKLSQQAIDELLHIIENFDRERGVPHNYMDLEAALQKIEIRVNEQEIFIAPINKN